MSQEKSDNGQTGTRGSPKKSRFRINVSRWAEKLPLLLFVIAVGLAGFTAGTLVMRFRVFPHDTIHSAYQVTLSLYHYIAQKTVRGELESEKTVVNVAPDGVEAHRIKFLTAAALTNPVLFWGGAMQFAEYCPGHAGCLAVEYARRGEVRHAYPYRIEELEKAVIPFLFKWLPFKWLPWFRWQNNMQVFSISRYSNGDILVIFHCSYCFLHRHGMARIARNGQPVWYRQNFNHHVPHVTDDDVALVPGSRFVKGPIVVNFRKKQRIVLTCQRLRNDFIHVVDGDGRILEEISILDAIIKSPYAMGFLRHKLRRESTCDPLHLNSVHELGEDAHGPNGIRPGDLVVSLRNLNAFGILDRDSHRLKKLVHGGFLRQHHVTHLAGSRFLMFDNYGTDGVHGTSRLLMVDVADGTATTIFPNDATPERLRGFFSPIKGTAFVSPDRRRVIVTFTLGGKAVEVRLADGAVLTEFTSLHDVSHVEQFPEEQQRQARLHELHGVSYVDRGKE